MIFATHCAPANYLKTPSYTLCSGCVLIFQIASAHGSHTQQHTQHRAQHYTAAHKANAAAGTHTAAANTVVSSTPTTAVNAAAAHTTVNTLQNTQKYKQECK